jgi:hypothetical protein
MVSTKDVLDHHLKSFSEGDRRASCPTTRPGLENGKITAQSFTGKITLKG